MNSYNMNKNIGLAKDIDINPKDQISYNTNIFTISDDISSVFDSFLLPNIKRKLGSYVIFDKNNKIYNLCENKFDNTRYEVEHYKLNDTLNLFSTINSENEIQILVKSVLRNCTEIQRYLYEGKTEIDLLYTQTDLILTLILIYITEKTPIEKRSFSYINKILDKLNHNDLDYFKKYFGKVDSSYTVQNSIFHLKYMTNEEYQKSLSILLEVLSKTSDTAGQKTTIANSITSLYSSEKLRLIFVELTDIPVVDSFFCSYIEEICSKTDASRRTNSVFYVYTPLEMIGYIPNLSTLIEKKDRKNDIHILSFNSIATAIKLYGKDIRTIMRNIHYGLLFQTNKEKNIKFTQKLLSEDTISTLMEQIQSNCTSCVVYKKNGKPSIEPKLLDT